MTKLSPIKAARRMNTEEANALSAKVLARMQGEGTTAEARAAWLRVWEDIPRARSWPHGDLARLTMTIVLDRGGSIAEAEKAAREALS